MTIDDGNALHAYAAASDRYLLLAGPTAANLQQRSLLRILCLLVCKFCYGNRICICSGHRIHNWPVNGSAVSTVVYISCRPM